MRIFLSKSIRSALLLMFAGMCVGPLRLVALGRIGGQIINGTTGRPAARQPVHLLNPANGVVRDVAVTQTDDRGSFVFNRTDVKPGDFYLLQAARGGVNYDEPVRFGPKGNASVSFRVYDSTTRQPPIRITSARFLIRAKGHTARVEELFAVRNATNPPVAYANPRGTFLFNLAKGAGQPSVAVMGEMNLPLPQQVQPAGPPGQFFIQYPLKPGVTVVMVAYEADYSAESFEMADSVPYPIDQIEMYVTPSSLAVQSPLFRPDGQDQETGGQKFLAADIKPDETIQASFQGAPLADSNSAGAQESGTVKEEPNAMTKLGWPLIGCFLLVLLWAMGVRVSKEWTLRDVARPGSPALKELEAKLEKLLDSVANLDELFEAGKLPEKKYWRERLDLKAKLVVLLRKTSPAFLESYATRHNPH
ncbi:MAG: carboxypeptidase-like regulatory domain-containing protein [Terriglobia bacterium]